MCEKQCCEEMKEYLAFKAEQEVQPSLPILSFEEIPLNTIARYKALAEPYGGLNFVCVGEVKNTREVYADNRIYVTITYPVLEPNLQGTGNFEGVFELSSPADVATLATSLHFGRTLIIDKKTKKVLEASIY